MNTLLELLRFFLGSIRTLQVSALLFVTLYKLKNHYRGKFNKKQKQKSIPGFGRRCIPTIGS